MRPLGIAPNIEKEEHPSGYPALHIFWGAYCLHGASWCVLIGW